MKRKKAKPKASEDADKIKDIQDRLWAIYDDVNELVTEAAELPYEGMKTILRQLRDRADVVRDELNLCPEGRPMSDQCDECDKRLQLQEETKVDEQPEQPDDTCQRKDSK